MMLTLMIRRLYWLVFGLALCFSPVYLHHQGIKSKTGESIPIYLSILTEEQRIACKGAKNREREGKKMKRGKNIRSTVKINDINWVWADSDEVNDALRNN